MSGSYLKVRIQPNARKNEIAGIVDGALKIKVNAVPEDGKANKAVCAFIADLLHLPKSAVSVAKGKTSREKWIAIDGLSVDEAFDRLAQESK